MLGGEIKKKVVVKLEEFSPYLPNDKKAGPLLTGNDSLKEVKPIYSYVDETINQAANEILLVAPLDKLTSEDAAHGCHVHNDGCIGTITTPPDFLRLRALRMNTWTRTVKEAQHPTSEKAYEQDNEWTRGTPQKPVVVLDECKLRYYSIAEGAEHTVLQYRYIPEFSVYGEYSELIAELIALNCAKKIYEVFQNTEGVSMMANEIKVTLEALAL